MRRTLLLALTPVAALSLVVPTRASAAAAPLMVDMSSAFDWDCTQERGVEVSVIGQCQESAFSESFIADEFLQPGTVTLRKQPFKIASTALNDKNCANGKGQVVSAPKKRGYKYLQVLVTRSKGGGGKGPKEGGLVTITYTDKSTAKVMLETYDWGGSFQFAAWKSSKQGALHPPTGGNHSSVFIEQLPLSSKKAVSSIKLPTFDGLRIFAMTLSNTSSALPKGPIFN